MSLKTLLQSIFPSGETRRKRRQYNRHLTPPMAIQLLEPREMLSATQDVGSLRFTTTGSFDIDGSRIETASPVQVGFIPQVGDTFKPLLNLSSGTFIDSTSGQEYFTTLGELSVISGATRQVVSDASNKFNITDLLGSGSAIAGGIQTFKVGAQEFTPYKLSLTFAPGSEDIKDTVVNLGGEFNFPALGNDGFSLDGLSSYVTAGIGSKLKATIDSSLDLRTNFSIESLDFAKPIVSGLSYDSDTDTLTLKGTSQFKFKGNTFEIAIGTETQPGLTITRGRITSFDFTSTSDFRIGTAQFDTQQLNASYVAANDTFTIKGTASAKIGDNTINVGLGTDGSAGLVISRGQLSELGFTTTSSLQGGGLSFKASPLIATYVDRTDTFTLSGTASFAFRGNSVQIGLGLDSTAGLVIAAGKVKQISGSIKTDLKIGGLKFKTDQLKTNYDAGNRLLTLAGTASFESKGTTFSVLLGSDSTNPRKELHGLVIHDGKLRLLDVTITGGFTIGAVKFKAKSLQLKYHDDPLRPTYTMEGEANLTFKAGGKNSSVDVIFGADGEPGLEIVGGSFRTMSLQVTSDLNIGSIHFETQNLILKYKAADNTTAAIFTASGKLRFSLPNKNSQARTDFQIQLGNTDALGVRTDGLRIQGGTLTTFDAAITGSLEFSKVKFKTKDLRFQYRLNGNESQFLVSGGASMSFESGRSKANADVNFGPASSPGLVIVNGSLRSLAVTINGSLNISSLSLTAKDFRVTYDANAKTFTASGALDFILRKVKINIQVGQKGEPGLVITDGKLTKLDASVTSSFEFSKFKFTTDNLRFRWMNINGNTRFELTGKAGLEFTLQGKKSTVSVEFGVAGKSGLVIENGSFKYMTLQVQGNLMIAGVEITAKDLTFLYDADASKFIMYGQIGVSVKTKGSSKKIIDNLTVTLGKSFDAPGIAVVNGTLTRFDLTINGTINVGPIKATATNLRAVYTESDGNVFITGDAEIKFGSKIKAAIGFPGRGLQINTNTGQVDVNGLKVSVGGIKLQFVEIKDFTIIYNDDGKGHITVTGSMKLSIVSLFDYKSEFVGEIVNGEIASVSLTTTGTAPSPLGPFDFSKVNLKISGLNTDKWQVSGHIKANFPILGKVPFLTIDGDLFVSDSLIQLKGGIVLISESVISGNGTITANLETSQLDITGRFRAAGGYLQSDTSFSVNFNTGYFFARSHWGLVIDGTTYAGAKVSIDFSPLAQPLYKVILPSSLTDNPANDTLSSGSVSRSIYSNNPNADRIYSSNRTSYLQMQSDGNLVLYRSAELGHQVIWATNTYVSNKSGYFECRVQADGNLVVYHIFNGKQEVLWASGTYRRFNSNVRLTVQNDGNVVLRHGNDVIWAAGKVLPTVEEAVVAIALRSNPQDKRDFAILAARDLRTTPGALLNLAAQAQVRRDVISSPYLQIHGEVEVPIFGNYKVDFRSNLRTGGVRLWLTVKPFYVSEHTQNLVSVGTLDAGGVFIVNSFAENRSARRLSAPLQARATTAAKLVDFDDTIVNLTPAPTTKIDSVKFDTSRNSAIIKYQAASQVAGSVSLFVSSNPNGSNARQIDAGLSTHAGVQTFEWTNVADSLPASFRAGQKLYFFSVVNDGIHDRVTSPIFKGIIAPQYSPTISVPGLQGAFRNKAFAFSNAGGNAIRITDPIEAINKAHNIRNGSDKLRVVVSTEGNGTLRVKAPLAGVALTGNGSNEITLIGTASQINATLDRLTYLARLGAPVDTITVAVRRLNSEWTNDYLTKSIDVEIDEIDVDVAARFDISTNGRKQSIFRTIQLKDVASDTLTSVAVVIKGYRKGKDFLSLNKTGISDLLQNGLGASFDANRGILRLTGGPVTVKSALRMLKNIQFSTTDSVTKKSLTIDTRDNAANADADNLLLV